MFDSNLVDHLLMIRKVSFDGFYWDLVHIFPSIIMYVFLYNLHSEIPHCVCPASVYMYL